VTIPNEVRDILIDRAKIWVSSGRGGKGATSFEKDRAGRILRPNGGAGGNGGDVVVRVDENVQTLLDFQYRRHFRAQSGGPGASNNRNGKNGKSLIVKVPVGTVFFDLEGHLLRDLCLPGQTLRVARGGGGGRGNSRFGEARDGESEEARELLLELKLIADVGIIGYPNAGKSTLISRISHARPRIADFPFTTLNPVLGTVYLPTTFSKNGGGNRSFVIADIPGLIEGAHQGKGLGDTFLKHIERTNLLVHLIDIGSENPYTNYKGINKELKFYAKGLAAKPQIVAANKMDLPEAENGLATLKKHLGEPVIPISAKTGQGVKKLIETICARLN